MLARKALGGTISHSRRLQPTWTLDAIAYPLTEHQKLVLTWITLMEDGLDKGGILADALGLGKLIQALALIFTQKSTDLARKITNSRCH